MAKRRAEPLLCHVPVKRLLREPPPPPRAAAPERRPRGEEASARPAAPKRKLEEAEAPPGKRPGLRGSGPRGEQGDAADRRRRRGGSAAPQDERAAEGCAGGRGKERAAAAEVTVRGRGGGRGLAGRMLRWAGPSCLPPGRESRGRCRWPLRRYRAAATSARCAGARVSPRRAGMGAERAGSAVPRPWRGTAQPSAPRSPALPPGVDRLWAS